MMNNSKDLTFMAAALSQARRNLREPAGGPFGACIVKKNKIIARARNTVLKSDATCHAEINAIRVASKKLKKYDLSECTIYSTTEPCPMCFSAIHWARIKRIVFSTRISDVKKIGFNELSITNKKMRSLAGVKMKIDSGVLYDQCLDLLKKYKSTVGMYIY